MYNAGQKQPDSRNENRNDKMARQRDDKGRFVKGQSGNPKGRLPRASELEYLEALKDILPLERFKLIVDSYAKRAERGDTRAAEVLFKYVLPQVSRTELTGKNNEPITFVLHEIKEAGDGKGT